MQNSVYFMKYQVLHCEIFKKSLPTTKCDKILHSRDYQVIFALHYQASYSNLAELSCIFDSPPPLGKVPKLDILAMYVYQTSMDNDLNGRRPIWKTTSMEDDLNGR